MQFDRNNTVRILLSYHLIFKRVEDLSDFLSSIMGAKDGERQMLSLGRTSSGAAAAEKVRKLLSLESCRVDFAAT